MSESVYYHHNHTTLALKLSNTSSKGQSSLLNLAYQDPDQVKSDRKSLCHLISTPHTNTIEFSLLAPACQGPFTIWISESLVLLWDKEFRKTKFRAHQNRTNRQHLK